MTAKFRLSLRKNQDNKSKKIPYDWSKLVSDVNIKTSYSVTVCNRFKELQDLDEVQTGNSVYENIIESHKKAAEDCVPLKEKQQKRIPWENENIAEKRKILKECQEKKQQKEIPENVERFEAAKEELDAAYLKEQEEYIKEKVAEIQDAHINQKSRLAWSTINEISGRKKTNRGQIKAESPEERVKLWKDHFVNLLGQTPVIDVKPTNKVIDELPIKTEDFTLDELSKAIKSLKNNKAAGLDEIPAEVWKIGCLDDQLLTVCNKTYNSDAPNIWLKGGILPFPKKGDLGFTRNYRGITLTVVAAKVYNRMLLNRIRPHLDPLLRMNQNGFREKRSTEAQILTLRRLIEGIKSKNLPAILTFIDFKKAFDSIHRGKLMEILCAYGIPAKVVSAINILHTETEAKVLSPDGDTDFFKILAGVLQGDPLAPYLFIIALDHAMRMATKDETSVGFTLSEQRSRRHPATTFTDTDFADDLALISNTLEQAQLFLLRVESAAGQIGLHLNESKTEFMSFNQPEGDLLTLNGSKLDQVNDFLYLGSWVDSSQKDINTRIAKAWSALSKMDAIWKSPMTNNLKIQFFRSTVETVLLYGSNTWTLTKALTRKLDGTYTRLLRAAINVSWRQHLTNKELYGNLPKVTDTIKERRLRFSGHCWRSKEEVVHKLLLWEPRHGRRRRGRPPRTFINQLCDDTGLEKEDLEKAMENRDG